MSDDSIAEADCAPCGHLDHTTADLLVIPLRDVAWASRCYFVNSRAHGNLRDELYEVRPRFDLCQ